MNGPTSVAVQNVALLTMMTVVAITVCWLTNSSAGMHAMWGLLFLSSWSDSPDKCPHCHKEIKGDAD